MIKKSTYSNSIIFFLLFFCLLELWLLGYGRNQFGIMWSPVIILISGLIIGIGFLNFFNGKEIELAQYKFDGKRRGAIFLATFFGVWKCGNLLRTVIRDYPLDFHYPEGSDGIHQIGIMVERFLNGIFPYSIITEWPDLGAYLFPTYLPLTWMPYIVPEIFGFDYRWMGFAILIIGFLYFFYKVIPWNRSWGINIVLLFLPFLFLYLFQKNDTQSIFRFSVETMIAGYYLILATALFSKSNLVRGVALLLCVLSRYSVVLWVPLFFFVLLFKEKKTNLFQIGGWLALGILGLYVIPFLAEDPTIFKQGYDYHTKAAEISFVLLPWQAEGELPAVISNGFGMAIYYDQFIDGSAADKLWALKSTHLSLLCLTVLISMIVFYKIKDKMDYRIFLLGTLKVYLVIFYNFIQIPFGYLFLTMVFISLPMMALLLGQVKIRDNSLKV